MSRTRSHWNHYLLAALVSLLPASPAAFAQSGWIDKDGRAIPEMEHAKSSSGFSATLMITADQDWQQKWSTSPDTVPRFTSATEVVLGGELFILTFLANPQRDDSGMTDVSCDFSVSRPDGSKSLDEVGMPCFKTLLTTDPKLVYLSAATVKFAADAADPKGLWTVDVTVQDRLRGVSLPLKTTFVVR